jgi:hypothetical protein
MGALHIRDIDDTLLKRLKFEALTLDVTLKEYVTDRLWNGGDTLREIEEEREAIGVGKVQAKPKRDRVPRVREDGGVRLDGGRVNQVVGTPAGIQPANGDCLHGTPIGSWCGFCRKKIEKGDCNA